MVWEKFSSKALEIKYDTPPFLTLTQRYASENYLVKDIQV